MPGFGTVSGLTNYRLCRVQRHQSPVGLSSPPELGPFLFVGLTCKTQTTAWMTVPSLDILKTRPTKKSFSVASKRTAQKLYMIRRKKRKTEHAR